MRTSNDEWDVFISHASEDKEDFVTSLAEGLRAHGLRVWYDEFTLQIGNRLRESIDHGLGQSRFGVVVLSPHFFSKRWPQNELDGLITREVGGLDVILPVWHNITREQVEEFSPTLADRVAARSEQGLERVIEALTQVIGPSATESKPRATMPSPPENPQQPPTDYAKRAARQRHSTAVPSGDPRLAEVASRVRAVVESMAKPGEKWTVSDGPQIAVRMYNPKDQTSGRGQVIHETHRDHLKSVMGSLRSYWADRHREDDEYARRLLMTKDDDDELDPRGWVDAENQPCRVYVLNAWADDFVAATWEGRVVDGKAEGEGVLVARWKGSTRPRWRRYEGLMRSGVEADPGVETRGYC